MRAEVVVEIVAEYEAPVFSGADELQRNLVGNFGWEAGDRVEDEGVVLGIDHDVLLVADKRHRFDPRHTDLVVNQSRSTGGRVLGGEEVRDAGGREHFAVAWVGASERKGHGLRDRRPGRGARR